MNSTTPTLTSKAIDRYRSSRNADSVSFRRTLLGALSVLSMIGCSDGRPPLFPVAGTVAFESGAPVRNASIEFVPSQPAPSPRGRIDANGNFSLGTYEANDGAPAGDYRVVVVQALPPGASASIRKLGEEHAAHAGNVKVVSHKHASPDSTGITCTVEPIDENDVAIVVESR